MVHQENSHYQSYPPFGSNTLSFSSQQYSLSSQYSTTQQLPKPASRQDEYHLYPMPESHDSSQHVHRHIGANFEMEQYQSLTITRTSQYDSFDDCCDNEPTYEPIPSSGGENHHEQRDENGRSGSFEAPYMTNEYAAQYDSLLAASNQVSGRAATLLYRITANTQENVNSNGWSLPGGFRSLSLDTPPKGRNPTIPSGDQPRSESICPKTQYHPTYNTIGDESLTSIGRNISISFDSTAYSPVTVPNLPNSRTTSATLEGVYHPPIYAQNQQQDAIVPTDGQEAELTARYGPMKCEVGHCKDKPERVVYRTYKDYRKHIHNVHLKPFSCPRRNCNKTFSKRADFSRHTLTHTRDKRYSCKHGSSCPRRVTEFSRYDKLKSHMKRWHQE
ncbi:hypothetical protein BP5796_09694 [Coleophoma crateriformis]|uniref:C2H2 type master regulator of conidiophore development brlA n=1 Tax=Coleophoma crateriformis TaxID=565419 RepID=A0A3D8QYW4_9HELO|nr:hypothetical protein BP5796_09694 [Coleophoma crateriformis]